MWIWQFTTSFHSLFICSLAWSQGHNAAPALFPLLSVGDGLPWGASPQSSTTFITILPSGALARWTVQEWGGTPFLYHPPNQQVPTTYFHLPNQPLLCSPSLYPQHSVASRPLCWLPSLPDSLFIKYSPSPPPYFIQASAQMSPLQRGPPYLMAMRLAFLHSTYHLTLFTCIFFFPGLLYQNIKSRDCLVLLMAVFPQDSKPVSATSYHSVYKWWMNNFPEHLLCLR